MKRTGLSDTSPEAQRVLDEVHRRMSPGHKFRLQAADFRCERSLHEAGYRQRHPGATREEIRAAWNAQRLGHGPWDARASTLERPTDNLDVVLEVVAALDRLNIAYALGGSWASSYYGEPRTTRDADLTVEPFAGKEAQLANAFGPDYYVSLDAVILAVRERRTFNVINIQAGFKVDLFVRKDEAFDLSVMSRRRQVTWSDGLPHSLVMISPEDTILHKLEWYRLGGEISERQWLDVLGVLRTQAGRLDSGYLDHWASELKVDDLLSQARHDAGV